jgi:hypothetical protein
VALDQVERGHRNPEVLGRRSFRQAERGIERGALNGGEPDCSLAHGSEQLMQPCKRQMRLGLHPGRGQDRDPPLACRPRDFRQQARLADAGLASKYERLAARDDPVQQRPQEALFLGATTRGVASSRVPRM